MSPSERPKTDRKRTTRKTTTAALAAAPGNDSPRVSETDIALRAFSLYCQRGCQHGADLEDWLRAERELAGGPAKPAARRRRASA